jgi:hypothetical protein
MSLKRTKMVSFRLSQEEYARFLEVCAVKGIRSISDLARVAMITIASQEVEIDPLSDQVWDIRRQVQSLSLELDRISNMVEARKAAGAS